jgi:hypothetical protein
VLTGDELRVESGLYLQTRRYWEGNKALLAGYLGLYGALSLAAVRTLSTGDWRAAAVGALAVTVLFVVGRAVGRRHGVGSADRIPLHDVASVAAVEGDDWLTRPRFVVRYWRGGEVRERYVMMPSGLLSYADEEFERAESAFRERGISVETVRSDDAKGRDADTDESS